MIFGKKKLYKKIIKYFFIFFNDFKKFDKKI